MIAIGMHNHLIDWIIKVVYWREENLTIQLHSSSFLDSEKDINRF